MVISRSWWWGTIFVDAGQVDTGSTAEGYWTGTTEHSFIVVWHAFYQ